MQYELNLRDYLRIFRKRKISIVATFCLVCIATFVNLSKQPYIYETSATVKIEERKSIAGILTEQIVYNPQDVMDSETRFVKSYPVMEGVAKRLGFVTKKTLPEDVHGIVVGLQGSVDARKIENTNIIQIITRGGDPKAITDLANTVAHVYIEQNQAEKSKQARAAKQFIEEQLNSIEQRLAKAEMQMASMGGRGSGIDLAQPIQSKLVDLEVELAAMLQKYTVRHPRIIQLKQQINELEGRIGGVSTKDELIYGRLAREVEANKKLYAMLKEKLEEARITEAQKVSDISIVDPAMIPTSPVEPNKRSGMMIGALLGLVLGVAVAFFSETMDPSIGTIEDVENVLKLPVLGVVPSIHAELETKKEGWIESLKTHFHWGAHERTKEMDRYVRLFVHYQPTSLFAEAFRSIQSNLKIDAENNKVFLITSAGTGEGKTTSLINLGLTCAQSGLKTLLVSSDLRRPSVAKAFGLKREFGLSEYLEGMLDYEGIVRNVSDMVLGEMGYDEILKFPGIENISIIPSGEVPANPAALLESKLLKKLLVDVRREFDLILLDAPPILPIADASIMAPLVDQVILVYEIGKTARQALMRAKMQVESTGARVAGIVLNNIKPRAEAMMFAYPYYYRYKYKEEKEKKGKG